MAFAAEVDNANVVDTESVCNEQAVQPYATTYVDSSGSFSVATGVMLCSTNMGSGTYTVKYSVSTPCTLSFWIDSYTCYDERTISGSGTITVKVSWPYTVRGWQLWADNQGSASYSLKITK